MCIRDREYTLLEVDIDTGRKNQIRAHLSELGCPVAGDRDYGACLLYTSHAGAAGRQGRQPG